MKRNTIRLRSAGFTLAEISIVLAVLTIVGGLAYSMLMNSTTLLAKNVSLNSSNTILRAALDRIYSEINQANGLPKLINADGTDAASSSGPAAGIIFDRYLGGPYIVTNPGTSGLSAAAQSFEMKRSTDALASPPIPTTNDVICMDNGTTRPLVSTCTTSGSGIQSLAITLTAPLGNAIPWSSTVNETAYLVHRKAFVVVPVSGRGELRMYNNAEAVANYNDPTTYVVLTREIGTQVINGLDEKTPFSLVTQNGNKFLSIAMRVEDQQFNKYLGTHQAKEFNTFLRVDTMLRPRNFLQ
jgi:prepilin-type N-terminal cleavage/methylation domain-containing protein